MEQIKPILMIMVFYAVLPYASLVFVNIANHTVILCQATAESFLDADLRLCQSVSKQACGADMALSGEKILTYAIVYKLPQRRSPYHDRDKLTIVEVPKIQ